MTAAHKTQLENQLWAIADILRGKMNADDFRDYILGFIFYKYLSEKMVIHAQRILQPGDPDYFDLEKKGNEKYLNAVAEDSVEAIGYFLKPSDHFHTIAQKGVRKGGDNFILDDLQRILKEIERSTLGTDSEEDFVNLFDDIDLTSTKLGRSATQKNDIIARVLSKLDEIDFQLEDYDSDILGDAYEYLIGMFATAAGKKAGEFYTPREVSTVLAKIVTTGRNRLKDVYDPCCGSGSLLLRVQKELEHQDRDSFTIYGQEMNRTTFNLCRMNLILHGSHHRNFDIRHEDTIEHPQHVDMKFEACVTNPPFSAKWKADERFMADERFGPYGKLAPKSKADYAFVLHMIHQLAENGTMAIILPHGVLFRGGAEEHIRRALIKDKNYLDAVIGLPPNLFYGTSIPACIMVFKKCRENPEDILFIDASSDFEKGTNQNVLRDDDIDRIVETYRERKEVEKYSHVAMLSEIRENDYNLNIPRYVDTFEEEEPVDLGDVAQKLRNIEGELADINIEIADFCEELGIEVPF